MQQTEIKTYPEGLTKAEIEWKIKFLERNIHVSKMVHGTEKFCKNRIARVAVLKSYLN